MRKKEDDMFCRNCGKEIDERAYTCPYCGFKTDSPYYRDSYSYPRRKSKIAAGLLAIFLGALGIHNFYLKRYKCAGVQLGITAGSVLLALLSIPLSFLSVDFGFSLMLTMLFISPALTFGVWIWSLVEGILIFCGQIKDGDGEELD